MKFEVSQIDKIIFTNRQNIPWSKVEQYLKQYIGQMFVVQMYQDEICIAGDFPNEFSESKYTKKLRGTLAKVKANSAQIIDSMITNAINRRWIENKSEKHKFNASEGWYRYDTHFSMPVKGSGEEIGRCNEYKATLVVRKTPKGLYLYDVVDIKKEASTPLEPEWTVR